MMQSKLSSDRESKQYRGAPTGVVKPKSQSGQVLTEYLIVLAALMVATLAIGYLVELLGGFNSTLSNLMRAVL